MIDETRRPDSEVDEPVFASDDKDSDESELESSPKTESGLETASEPRFLPETEAELLAEEDSEGPSGDEPVFSAGDEPGVWQESETLQEASQTFDKPQEWEYASVDRVTAEDPSGPSTGSDFGEPEFDTQAMADAESSWADIAPTHETVEENRPATEYNYFEETPAAEVASSPPPTRKLGRTGPVWVLGGFTLVLIAGLIWLGISRLTGSSENSSTEPSEPTVQQVVADAPTPAPPTSTPGPTPTPTPKILPINANVIVGGTDGQGVKLRNGPGIDSELLEIIDEGTTMVVLDAEPGSEHADYPVPRDGYLWYRMRVPSTNETDRNQVIGWSASEFFIVEVP